MRRSRRLLLATALGAAACVASGAGVEAAAPSGEIVFASDRATANPGEIYALAPGRARRDLSRSPYADVALATSPTGRAFAFWSNRSGAWRLMLSADGRKIRSVAVARGAGPSDPMAPPVFAAGGATALIPYSTPDAISQLPQYAVVSVRSGAVRRLDATCGAAPALSPDGRLVACPGVRAGVSVADVGGHVLFTVPGKTALWSPDGRLAVATATRTRVLSAGGRVLARVSGVARAWSRDGGTLALARPGALVLVRPGRAGGPRAIAIGGSGAPFWVAFTPDGRDVVYGGGLADPKAAPVAGGRARPFAGQPFGTWSRDGRYAFTIPGSVTVALAIGDRLGRHARVVARLPYAAEGISALAWLGDGSAVLYDGSTPGRGDLWTMRGDGSGQRRLTATSFPVAQPAWSRDGARLAYSTDGALSKGGIVIADARGHRASVIAGADPGAPSTDGNPSWSPDGTRVAVDDAEAGGIHVLDVAGGHRSDFAVDGVSPAWSPGGATIAFVDLDDGTVWGAAPNGGGRHRLLPPAVREVTSVSWSPDGKTLAYSTASGIYLAAPGAESSSHLLVAAADPGRPSFSPDGRWIAYAADAGSVHAYRAISVVAIDGGRSRRLTTGPYDSSDPAWRPA